MKVCEWPTGPNTLCGEEAVALIGLPYRTSRWVCLKHFNEWSEGEGQIDSDKLADAS